MVINQLIMDTKKKNNKNQYTRGYRKKSEYKNTN